MAHTERLTVGRLEKVPMNRELVPRWESMGPNVCDAGTMQTELAWAIRFVRKQDWRVIVDERWN